MEKVMNRDDVKSLIKELMGPEIADFRNDLEKGLEKATSHMSGILAADRKAETSQAAEAEKGIALARTVRMLALAKGNIEEAAGHAERLFGKESAVTKDLSSSIGSAGGILASVQQSTDLIEFLRPQSAVIKMNPTVVPLDGIGTLSLPRIAGGATASYVGENQDIVATEQTTDEVVLTSKELAAIVPIANKLLNVAALSVDRMVRDDLAAAIAQRGDLACIRGDGSQNTPKGLRYWVDPANVVPITGGNTLALITSGLGSLILALKNANVRFIRPGWLMSPRTELRLMTVLDNNGNFVYRAEMLQGKLWGLPYATTTQIPDTISTNKSELYLADFADVVIGQGSQLQLEASNVAPYKNSGGTLVSAYSRNQTVIRAIQGHDLVVRHPKSIAVGTGVDWA